MFSKNETISTFPENRLKNQKNKKKMSAKQKRLQGKLNKKNNSVESLLNTNQKKVKS
jgi:hypothetical protein